MKDQSKSFRCMKCNSILTVSARKARTLDGAHCGACGGPLLGLPRKSKLIDDLTVKLDIDCSDTIKGLKAVQREARKATQVLTELANKVPYDVSQLKASLADDRVKASDFGINDSEIKAAVEVMNHE